MPPKVPTVEELIRDRKARERLTPLQLASVVEQFRSMVAGLGRAHDKVESNPADFASRVSGGAWRIADHLRYLSDQLARLERREIRFLAVSMPPRHGKSLLIDVWLPIWWLTRDPTAKIILASYGETFSRMWGAQVRDKVIEHSEDLNLVISKDQTAADDWQTNVGGGMVSVGVGGSLTGRGADLLIIDDPIKNDQEANSLVYRERMWNWWQASAFTRLQPNGVVVVVCTRWHEDDLLGRLEKEDPGRWTFVRIPALAEKDDPLGRPVGAPLWPEQFTDDPDYQIRQGSISPYWWAAQFQQRPVPEGGGIIQRDWFKFYNPKHTADITRESSQIIQSWDPALLDKATSDFWVGQVWARRGADLFLLDSARGHYNLAQAIGIIRTWTIKYPKAIAKLVENSAMGPAIKQTLQHEVPGIVPWPPKGASTVRWGSKFSRVQAIVPVLMAGNVFLPENENGTKPKWVWELIEECAAFDKGAHDDQVDALSQAISFLLPGAWQTIRKVEQEADIPPAKTPREIRTEQFNAYTKRILKKASKVYSPHYRSRLPW